MGARLLYAMLLQAPCLKNEREEARWLKLAPHGWGHSSHGCLSSAKIPKGRIKRVKGLFYCFLMG